MSSKSKSSLLSLWVTILLVSAAFLALFTWDWWPQTLSFSLPTCFLWSSFAHQLSLVCSAAWCWVGTALSYALYPNKVSDLLVSKFEDWEKLRETWKRLELSPSGFPSWCLTDRDVLSCCSLVSLEAFVSFFKILVKTWRRSLKFPKLISNSLYYMTT